VSPGHIELLEWTAAAFGVVNIALLVWRSVWNYPFGMVMVLLYIAVFFSQRLYAESGLQVFFFLAQGYGWWLWVKAGKGEVNDGMGRVPVRWLDPMSRAVWLVATAAVSLNLGWIEHRFTSAQMPYADSAIAIASVAAQMLLAFRRVENWMLWIAIDVASIMLYIDRGLYPTAGLYGGMLVMSIVGLREWVVAAKSELRSEPVPA
jgi:nicotinamide mononucleotide transporter